MLKIKFDCLWSLCRVVLAGPTFMYSVQPCHLFFPLAWLSFPHLLLASDSRWIRITRTSSCSCLTVSRTQGPGSVYVFTLVAMVTVYICNTSLPGTCTSEIEDQHLSRRVTDIQIPAIPPYVCFSAEPRKSLEQTKHTPSCGCILDSGWSCLVLSGCIIEKIAT